MKKAIHILITIIIMLIVSRFIIRIIDASVQIDDDMPVLILILAIINCVLGYLSFIVCRSRNG